MDWNGDNQIKKRVFLGCFFIALGVLLMLDRFTGLGLGDWGQLWPFIFIALGAARLLEGRVGSATTLFLLGTWFLVCENGWWGFGYGNSWPLIIVFVGVGMVVRALCGERWSGCRIGGGAA